MFVDLVRVSDLLRGLIGGQRSDVAALDVIEFEIIFVSTCITVVIEFEIVFAIIGPTGIVGSCCNDESAFGIHDGAVLDVTTFFAPSILRAQALICSLREDVHGACLDPSMGWYAEVDALCHLA